MRAGAASLTEAQLEQLDSRIEELERQPDLVQTIQLMFLRLELPTVARKYDAAHAQALRQGVRPGVEYHATTSAGVAYSVRITAAGGEAWRLE